MDKYVVININACKCELIKVIDNKIVESLVYTFDSTININIVKEFANSLPIVSYDKIDLLDTYILNNEINVLYPLLDNLDIRYVADYLEYKEEGISLINKLYKHVCMKKYVLANKDVSVRVLQKKFIIGINEAKRLLKDVNL